MKFAIPAATLTLFLLRLRTLSAWRRLTALRTEIDQALERFRAQQFGRTSTLAALIDLANEHLMSLKKGAFHMTDIQLLIGQSSTEGENSLPTLFYEYTFAHDNGGNPVIAKARAYVGHWPEVFKRNIGGMLGRENPSRPGVLQTPGLTRTCLYL